MPDIETFVTPASVLDLTAGQLVAAFRARTLTPSAYFEQLDRHIARWEPKIAALYAYDPQGAYRAAEASTARWARGAPIGPLDGVPVTLKELIATKGTPVPLGTAATALTPAAADAPPAARLREAGAILFAKTTCPDFGMLSSGLSSFHPLTRNPWNLATNPGGSSAGAGAAAAAGYGPLHVGTDIGGSTRLPAAWCGIFGFKPSHGRVPVDPFYLGRAAGPMTRTVDDAALLMSVLSRPDRRDPTSLPVEAIAWSDLERSVAGRRLGVMTEAGCGLPVEPAIRDAVLAAARVFERMGATLVEVPPMLSRAMLDGLDDFWRARSWGDLSAMPDAVRARVLPYIVDWAGTAAAMDAVRAVRGYNQTVEMRKACARALVSVDALLSPTTPISRFPAEWASPVNDPQRPFEHIVFTVAWNMGEQPAASINCGFTLEGAPIGLQIVGPRFADLFVLQLAKAYEGWRGPTPWPALS